MSVERPETPEKPGPYQLFVLVLCVWAILILGVDSAVSLAPETRTILLYADTLVCGIFFGDFLHSLYKAPNRGAYLLRWGWIDLLSSIPSVGVLRIGRAARIMRVLRVLRGVKSAGAIAHFVAARRAQSTVLVSVLLAILLLVVASIAILQFESSPAANIRTAEDAMWWAVSTMATVGYGDRYPVSAEGRVVAVFLMVGGVGLFGVVSGLVASWFLTPVAKDSESELEEIRDLLRQVVAKSSSSRDSEVGSSTTIPALAPTASTSVTHVVSPRAVSGAERS